MLGFLTTLLLSLPQLATLQRATVNVGTQVDVPAVEESIGREYIYHTEQLHVYYTHLCIEKSHHAHLSLEQRILAFEKECEERTQKAMEEKVTEIYYYSFCLYIYLFRYLSLKMVNYCV